MLKTPNFNLNKPEGRDMVDINILNENFDVIDEALAPTADPNQIPNSCGPAKVPQWISWITNRVNAITGKTNWYDKPDITLVGVNSHVTAAAPHKGHVLTTDVVEAPAAGKLLKLDSTGKLPASITGNADTLDGKHASDFAAQNHMAVKTAYISNEQVYTPIEGYANHAYFASLRSLQFSLPATTVRLPAGSNIGGSTCSVSDIDLVQIECRIDEATKKVYAKGILANNTTINGVANIMELAWN